MNPNSPLRDFLATFASLRTGHPTVHGHVLTHGKIFQSQPLTTEETNLLNTVQWRTHRPKHCFQNAQETALALHRRTGPDIKVRYAEGFIMHTFKVPMPVAHAWVSLNGKVVDTTLRPDRDNRHERVTGIIPEEWQYMGVELEPERSLHALHHGHVISLLDDWKCGWPLLQSPQDRPLP